MAYTIKYHGYDVACDSPEELRALLGDLNGSQPKPANPSNPAQAPLWGAPASGISSMVAKIDGKPRELLCFISNNGTVPRERLFQAVGLSDPHKLGGLLISLSKYAQSAGVDPLIERITERVNGNGPRTYHYKIRENAKAEVKEALSK
jgi:hypothetical protein